MVVNIASQVAEINEWLYTIINYKFVNVAVMVKYLL